MSDYQNYISLASNSRATSKNKTWIKRRDRVKDFFLPSQAFVTIFDTSAKMSPKGLPHCYHIRGLKPTAIDLFIIAQGANLR